MLQTNFLCAEKIYNISLKLTSCLAYVSKKPFFVLKNYVI